MNGKGELQNYVAISKMKEIIIKRIMKPGHDQNTLYKNFKLKIVMKK